MKRFISLFSAFILVLCLVCPSSFADNEASKGTLYTAEQKQLQQEIRQTYGIDAVYLYFENQDENIRLSDLTAEFIDKNGLNSKWIVFALSPKYYCCSWSEDLDGTFRSADDLYIFNSLFDQDSGDVLTSETAAKNYFKLLLKMLQNRTNCPYRYIKDEAGVLSDSEEKKLNETLAAFHEKCAFDLVVVLTNGVDNGVYSDDRMDFADDYYDYNGYGYGKNRDGALLLVNIGEFDTYSRQNSWISTCGSGIGYIGDEDISAIGNELTPLLLEGKYYEAVSLFPDLIRSDILSVKSTGVGVIIVVALIVSLIGASAYCGKLKRQLRSVQDATEANNYIVDNSLVLTRAYDHFLYAHVSKTKRESSSSRGGHSGHTSSSGSSHGGGGF